MAMSDRNVATTIGALIFVLAAAACGGDGAGDSPPVGQSDVTAAADQPEPGSDPGQSADGAPPSTTRGDADGERKIDPSTLELGWIEAQVLGLGGGGLYVYYPDPEVRQRAEELLEEVLAEGDDYVVVRPTEGEPEATVVDAGGCLILYPQELLVASDGVYYMDGAPIFDAYVRYSQAEYLSLADNGVNSHGGFAKGGVRRDESQQWEIFGEGPLSYNVGGSADVGYVAVSATWTGKSIENFSGDEADGLVEIACIFFAPTYP